MSYDEYCLLKRDITNFIEFIFGEMKRIDFKSYALFLSLAQTNSISPLQRKVLTY